MYKLLSYTNIMTRYVNPIMPFSCAFSNINPVAITISDHQTIISQLQDPCIKYGRVLVNDDVSIEVHVLLMQIYNLLIYAKNSLCSSYQIGIAAFMCFQ